MVDRREEVGKLLQTMQQMGSGLSGIVSGLQSGIEWLASNAQSLSAVTEQTNREVGSQKEQTEQVATAMHQMTTTVHDVARNADEAAQAADDEVDSEQQVVRQSLQRIEQLASSARAASQPQHREPQCGNPDHRFGAGGDQERGRADQPIGAQRGDRGGQGGEQGLGFAVVADEVRALARRTQQSTKEIERLVSSLRSIAQASVAQIQGSGELVKQAVTDALETESALGSIAAAVSQIQQMIQQISAAAE